jgi:hypothetical protein
MPGRANRYTGNWLKPRPSTQHPPGVNHLSKTQNIASWLLQLTVAIIVLQTLFFKFTGAEESVYIFSAIGRLVPWRRALGPDRLRGDRAQRGDVTRELQALRRVVELSGNSAYMRAHLAFGFATSGDRARAIAIQRELESEGRERSIGMDGIPVRGT